MNWQDIREIYPDTWLLIEAIEAHTEGDKRILDKISVIDRFVDGQTAWQAYAKVHRENPDREMFVFHTDRAELDITIKRWLGLRGVR
ncbi:MAG: hypothetical protein KJ069_23955 [Anaerolineae bacterium]|nr:hypothetical protein [Anaerolineae bacterium]